jgi:hypothetical protein
MRLEGLSKLKESSDMIENLTRDLPACRIVPHPTRLSRALEIQCDVRITCVTT